jgi:hypothetical protein
LAEPEVSLAKMAAIKEAAAEMDKLARRIPLMPCVFPWKSKRYSRKPASFHDWLAARKANCYDWDSGLVGETKAGTSDREDDGLRWVGDAEGPVGKSRAGRGMANEPRP